MTVIKVRDGTPKTATSLCVSCRYATVIKGSNFQYMIRCHRIEQMVRFPVSECSEYENKSMPTQYDMEQIAWIVQTRNRGPAGFQGDKTEIEIVPPKKDE